MVNAVEIIELGRAYPSVCFRLSVTFQVRYAFGYLLRFIAQLIEFDAHDINRSIRLSLGIKPKVRESSLPKTDLN